MANTDYTNLSINIKEGFIYLKQNEESPGGRAKFDTLGDGSFDVRVEFRIAKIFHKVLNLIKVNPKLFKPEDFELLGEMLSNILFGKSDNPDDGRNYLIRGLEKDIDGIVRPKTCRIFLEFDLNSGVAMLPWEYTLYKPREVKKEAFYLSANKESRFHLIRRTNKNDISNPDTDKIFIIVLAFLEGNADAIPIIDKRPKELAKLKGMFEKLGETYKDSLVIEYMESVPYNEIKQNVKQIYNKWQKQYDQRPYYIIHYIGHADFRDQIGRLVVKSADPSISMEWKEDKKFASLFRAGNQDQEVPQPSVVCLQACDSAKIGNLEGELRGVAYEFTKLNVPAVVGMQNEINAETSCAFFEKFYECLLESKDIAEAVTTGRDYLGREYDVVDETYINNYFGSPVLFITTKEPIRLLKPKQILQQSKDELIEETPSANTRPLDIRYESKGRAEPQTVEASVHELSRPLTQTQRVEIREAQIGEVQADNALGRSTQNQRTD